MKKNPVATITFSNDSVIQIELYPDIAPNAVTSFIYLAKQGVYNHYPIERIVPGWVLDMSYHAFHNPKACYFIPNDVKSGKYLGLAVMAHQRLQAENFSFHLRIARQSLAFILFSEKL